jgi:hypothetical protein
LEVSAPCMLHHLNFISEAAVSESSVGVKQDDKARAIPCTFKHGRTFVCPKHYSGVYIAHT